MALDNFDTSLVFFFMPTCTKELPSVPEEMRNSTKPTFKNSQCKGQEHPKSQAFRSAKPGSLQT